MQTRIDQKKRTALYSFDNLYEFGNWIATAPRTWNKNIDESTSYGSNAAWDLNAGYEGAVRMAQEGWLEGAQRVQDALKAFIPATAHQDTKNDVYGFRPHVARFCAGAPDCMVRHTRNDATAGQGRVLTLAVPVDANANTKAAHMANFGVAVAQYVNQLETQGVRVELVAVLISDLWQPGWRMCHAVTIKRAGQPLDLAVVAFAIGHPAMLRRLGFAASERSERAAQMASYGRAADAKLSDLINPAPGTFILNGMKDANTHAVTPQAAFEYVQQQIEKAMEAQYND